MANFLYVTEYEDPTGSGLPREPELKTQTVTISSSANSSVAFTSSTRLIRMQADTTCAVLFGTAPTATLTSQRVSSSTVEWRIVPSNTVTQLKVSVIANS